MMHDLGTLGGTNSRATAINASGQVVGESKTPGDAATHAFLFTGTVGGDGVMLDLGVLGGDRSQAYDINAHGQVVGKSTVAPGDESHAFLYTGTPGVDGVMHDLDALGGFSNGWSNGWSINDSGQVTGHSQTASGYDTAILYTGSPGVDGIMRDLGSITADLFPGYTGYSQGMAINARGQVTGDSTVGLGDDYHAFLYTGAPGVDGVMHDLGTLGGSASRGLAVNSSGQVVGYSWLSGNSDTSAFVYVGTPGVDGRMIDLDAWLDEANPSEGAKWTHFSPNDLSDDGFITGAGYYDDGPGGLSDGVRAFLLDARSLLVVPEPTTSVLLALAVPAILRRGGSAGRRERRDALVRRS